VSNFESRRRLLSHHCGKETREDDDGHSYIFLPAAGSGDQRRYALANTLLTVVAHYCPPRAVCTPRIERARSLPERFAPAFLISRMIESPLAAWLSAR
jgi:hypothetical protein